MKKLIIALAAVALAAVSQAATTNWKFNLGTTGTLKSGYLADLSGTPAAMGSTAIYILTSSEVNGGISQADLVKAFQDAPSTFNIASYALKDAVGETNASGKIPSTASVTFSSEVFESGTYYDFYAAVVVDANSDGVADYLYVSANKNVAAYDSSKTQTITPVVSTSSNYIGDGEYTGAAGWYKASEAVPEPTSGLMMLLGLGALALRRRRA